MMRVRNRSTWTVFVGAGLAVIMALAFTGCEDARDDESDVRVNNWDNHDYTVRLYQVSDNALVGEMVIQEGDSRDFDGIDEGRYYVTIVREGQTAVQDRSGNFTIEDEEDVTLTINGNGDIR